MGNVLKILIMLLGAAGSLGKLRGNRMSNGTTTTTSNFASILTSITSLGGLLGHHSNASTQAGALLSEIQAATAEGNWAQVLAFSNSLMAVPNLSVASMNNARALMTAAQAALNTVATMTGATPAQALQVNLTNQQLILSEVAGMRTQLASETNGIFARLLGLHNNLA